MWETPGAHSQLPDNSQLNSWLKTCSRPVYTRICTTYLGVHSAAGRGGLSPDRLWGHGRCWSVCIAEENRVAEAEASLSPARVHIIQTWGNEGRSEGEWKRNDSCFRRRVWQQLFAMISGYKHIGFLII